MATALFAETLDNSQHSTRLTPENLIYPLNQIMRVIKMEGNEGLCKTTAPLENAMGMALSNCNHIGCGRNLV
jgi:hypothetical protein